MLSKTMLDIAKNISKKDMAILKQKNNDYATNDNCFANFQTSELFGLITTDQAIASRMLDKMKRICNLLGKEASVQDETIQDTLSDLRNYSTLLEIYLLYGKQQG